MASDNRADHLLLSPGRLDQGSKAPQAAGTVDGERSLIVCEAIGFAEYLDRMEQGRKGSRKDTHVEGEHRH
jgi:hypothetical protein